MSTPTVNDLNATYRKRFLFYNPTPKQLLYHNISSDANEVLLVAANRIGKTLSGCMEDSFHATGYYPPYFKGRQFNHPTVGCIATKSFALLRDVIQSKLFGGNSEGEGFKEGIIYPSLVLNKALRSGVRDALDYVDIRHISGGITRVYFKSYDQGREEFQGARYHWIHFDEECPFDIYVEACLRLASVDSSGQGLMKMTTTPLKGFSPMMCYFLRDGVNKIAPENVVNGKVYIQAQWSDNPYLSKETISVLEKTLTPFELEARKYGRPYSGIGMVYYDKLSDFVIPPFEIPKHWYKFYGLDVGFTAPTAAVFLAHDTDNDVIYLYGEYSQTQLTSIQHAANLINLGCINMMGFCDPSIEHVGQRDGKTQLDDYLSQGLSLHSVKYAKLAAVIRIRERIRTGRFKIFSNCVKTLDEWSSYTIDKNGKIEKGNDHLMNALEFAILDGLSYSLHTPSQNNDYNRMYGGRDPNRIL